MTAATILVLGRDFVSALLAEADAQGVAERAQRTFQQRHEELVETEQRLKRAVKQYLEGRNEPC